MREIEIGKAVALQRRLDCARMWREDKGVRPVQSLLARALAVLLLVQWAGGPAHCLALAAFTAGAGVICHAEPSTPDHPDGKASLDQACPACHELGQLAAPVAPVALPERVVWWVAAPPAPAALIIASVPRAPPQQPRAPPATSV
jgi:hypothetical protein